MRLARAIDRFLEQKQVERDWTPSSIRSYRRILLKLIDEHGWMVQGVFPTDVVANSAGRFDERIRQ